MTSLFECDPAFLYRCCSTHNFNAIFDYKSAVERSLTQERSPSPDDEHRNCRSDGSRDRLLRELRHRLLHTDEWGNTCIHAAAYNNPSAEVFEALISLSRRTVPPIDLSSIRCNDGSTPLHVACGWGCHFSALASLTDHLSGEAAAKLATAADDAGRTALLAALG